MSVRFILTSKTRVDTFNDRASLGDITEYEFDCTAWEEDNDTITSATWVCEGGNVTIADEAVASGLVSAMLTFNQDGKQLVSILLNTAAGLAKKIWLELHVKDTARYLTDDYGINT